VVETLARVRPLHVVASVNDAPADNVATSVLSHAQVVLPLAGLIDLDAERDRTTKELQEAQSQVDRLSQKLGDAEFRSKAPADVVARQEEMLASARSRLTALEQRLDELG
jgi:valyl-tRNA synthetase